MSVLLGTTTFQEGSRVIPSRATIEVQQHLSGIQCFLDDESPRPEIVGIMPFLIRKVFFFFCLGQGFVCSSDGAFRWLKIRFSVRYTINSIDLLNRLVAPEHTHRAPIP